MSATVERPNPAGAGAPPTDFDEVSEPAPAVEPEAAGEAETVVQGPEVEVSAPPPAAEPAAPREEEAAPEPAAFSYGLWNRFHLVLGGGYNFGTSIAPEEEPFASAAQSYHGGSLILQPSVTAFALNPRADKPNGDLDIRAGIDFRTHFLTNPNTSGVPSSGLNGFNIGVLGEINGYFHRHFGLGGQFNLGYMGWSSDNVDVGAPYSAHLDFDGGFNLGGQVYLNFWDGNIRLGGGIDHMLTSFEIDAGPGNPPLRIGSDPMWQIFGGFDILGIVRSIQGSGSSSE